MTRGPRQLCTISGDSIDPEAAKVVRRLTRYDYEAYLVGGCVRDMLLGGTPKDFDVSTNATPTEIRKLFRNSRIIGRRFRLVHIFFGRKIIETATFRAQPPPPDSSEGDLLIWRDNVFGSSEEDAQRRDFTINGLFYDLNEERVIDTVEGIDDLRAGLVRTIGDPHIRFQEDPVRILRAIKFAARLDMAIEEQTLRALVEHRGLIARCSIARVLEEIYRLLGSGNAHVAFELMQRTGVLAVLFPLFSALLPEPGDELACSPVPAIESPTTSQRTGTRRSTRRGGRRRRRERDPEMHEDASAEAPDEAEASEAEASEVEAPDEAEASEAEASEVEAPDEAEAAAPLPLPAAASSTDDDESPANVLDIIARQGRTQIELLEHLELESDEHRRRAAESLWRHLRALDERVREGDEPPTRAVLLAALLAPLLFRELEEPRRAGWVVERIDALVRAVAERIQVSRRDKERLRQILVAQRRMTQGRPRQQLARREYFREAYELLELRQVAGSAQDGALDGWEELADHKRRRRPTRQRGGRRRRR